MAVSSLDSETPANTPRSGSAAWEELLHTWKQLVEELQMVDAALGELEELRKQHEDAIRVATARTLEGDRHAAEDKENYELSLAEVNRRILDLDATRQGVQNSLIEIMTKLFPALEDMVQDQIRQRDEELWQKNQVISQQAAELRQKEQSLHWQQVLQRWAVIIAAIGVVARVWREEIRAAFARLLRRRT